METDLFIYSMLHHVLLLMYVILYIGLWTMDTVYLETFHYYIKLFIGIVFFTVYNPNKKISDYFKKTINLSKALKRHIVYTTGITLLLNTGLSTFFGNIKGVFSKIKNINSSSKI